MTASLVGAEEPARPMQSNNAKGLGASPLKPRMLDGAEVLGWRRWGGEDKYWFASNKYMNRFV